jgi:hypothetical protein
MLICISREIEKRRIFVIDGGKLHKRVGSVLSEEGIEILDIINPTKKDH